jgi:hypothetical protein
VDARKVRQSMRTKVSWPTTARRAAAPPEVGPRLVDLVDISIDGAMVSTPETLGAIGELVELAMDVVVDENPVQLHLTGKICHHNRPAGQEHFFAGLAFQGATQNDKMLLNYLTQNAST